MSNDTLEVGLPTPSESEEAKQTEQDTPEVTADSEVETKQEESRLFTQAELDAAIQKRLLKEERRVHRRIEQQLREQHVQRVAQVEPQREHFRDDEAYFRAQIEHLAERRAAEKLAERDRTMQERMSEAFLERAASAEERYPDFQVVVGNPNLPINTDMAEFIAESEHGPDVAYYLGKNPLQAAKIAAMSPVKAARELTRIETELASKPKAKASKAPEPINPVGSRGKASSTTLPSDDDDIETWMRKERQRRRG